ncbi:hypothetical protein FDECE_18033 [Fusarium decemcellulare]|nr:hypothetical protein FDECE_18033 [Fusarium decemcellulare]
MATSRSFNSTTSSAGPHSTLGAETTPRPTQTRKSGKRKPRKRQKKNLVVDQVDEALKTAPYGTFAKGVRNGLEHKGVGKFHHRSLLSENNPYMNSGDFDKGDLVYCFMTKGETEPRRMKQADFVDSFCPRTTLGLLESPTSSIPSKNICLIDDRTNAGKDSISLGYYGPLTVRQLHLKLKEKRYHCKEESPAQVLESPIPPEEESFVPLNADRRLIFITDADQFSVAALMSTASASQASSVADAIYRYMAFQPHIASCLEPRGFPFFSLSFHLPFYSWKSTASSQVPRDPRQDRDGNPLRKVIDISFLTTGSLHQAPFSSVDCLCEAEVSVLITGIDDCRWTGLCLVDTYFQHEEDRESVDTYHDYNQEFAMEIDPFSEGNLEASRPLRSPREYFVAVFDCRAKGFREEWQALTSDLHQRIEQYIRELPLMSNKSISPTNDELKKSLAWIGQTRRILRKLIKSSRATIERWNDFEQKKEFQTDWERKHILSIEETFKDVGYYADDLESLYRLCEDYTKYLALWMNSEGTRDTNVQAQLAKSTQTVTYFMVYFVYPTTLAATMLSMQEKAIPGILGPTKLSFVILALVLAVIVSVAVQVMQWWDEAFRFLRGLLESQGITYFRPSSASREHPQNDMELGVDLTTFAP